MSENDDYDEWPVFGLDFSAPAQDVFIELARHLNQGGISTEDYLALECLDNQGITWKLGVFLVERPKLKLVEK